MAKNLKHKIIFVEWIDAESIDAWTESSEIDFEMPRIISCGLLINDSKNVLTIAVNFDQSNDCYSCIMKIPKGMIVSQKIIRS